ncbi:MAG TPA: hypothetical protein VLT45_32150 [Kofleriaceae bacterium]|nr:hypothetical protein [Kofleriaceae bacterium]
MLRPVALLLALTATASAGESLRFGVTTAIKDPDASGHFELGPMVGIGERLGRFLGELDYAYLSFIDPDTQGGQVQRVGVNLRFDVDRSFLHCTHYACTRATSFYVEAGAAERFGHWVIDSAHVSPVREPNPEAHIGLGLEWDNQITPHRNGWQLGLRVAFTPNDAVPVAARGSTMPPADSGTNTSVFVEWMYLLGD